jgi:hypothetical protein
VGAAARRQAAHRAAVTADHFGADLARCYLPLAGEPFYLGLRVVDAAERAWRVSHHRIPS